MYYNDYYSAPSFGGVAMTVNIAMRLADVIVDQDQSEWAKGVRYVKNARVCEDLGISGSDLETLMGHARRINDIVESM